MNLMVSDNVFDLGRIKLRDLNSALHGASEADATRRWVVKNPNGAHAVAAGIRVPLTVQIDGHVGYYCAGMNQRATVIVNGNAGVGVAENMMSGAVHVHGDASQAAGATGRGGQLIIDGNAAARCGISMKGIDILVKGSIGHMSAFMGQAGDLIVLGNAGEYLGDSLYEARLFVRGSVASLGSDCIEKPMKDEHKSALHEKLKQLGVAGEVDVSSFKRYGSARRLYNFHVDNAGAY